MAAAKVFAFTTTGVKFALNMMLCLTAIRYVEGAGGVAGHECQVQDANGNVIFDSFSTGANFADSQRFDKYPMINGLNIAVLGGGTVYVEVD